ncbi:hypothetical protein ILUMI_22028 [Ignelater luminosus]|uniref:Uncharacterized protein n=1 Tax=Ignelater luminosus TaxID=2038154 RepID=A0A8K0CBC8_IGNLU|nr:hypothetical protein ILUMI_22028 [Ignelater luminosus]
MPHIHLTVIPLSVINRVIGTVIHSYIKDNHRLFGSEIFKIAHAIRNAVHEVTDFTPSFLNFGCSVPCHVDYYGKLNYSKPIEVSLDSCKQLVRVINQLSPLHIDVAKWLNIACEHNKRQYDLRKRLIRFKKDAVESSASKDMHDIILLLLESGDKEIKGEIDDQILEAANPPEEVPGKVKPYENGSEEEDDKEETKISVVLR